jgi:hypothetical protein
LTRSRASKGVRQAQMMPDRRVVSIIGRGLRRGCASGALHA